MGAGIASAPGEGKDYSEWREEEEEEEEEGGLGPRGFKGSLLPTAEGP